MRKANGEARKRLATLQQQLASAVNRKAIRQARQLRKAIHDLTSSHEPASADTAPIAAVYHAKPKQVK